ncbi:hypothetical protein A2246_00145 [candidate division WOR-1 bacterium RIFOXYA2_FULL_37_7]|nr:MAG: hypothetical protein A2246_00145 [candidate division WOR-1 bacterium RIFOXYA2_FULL_37_7]
MIDENKIKEIKEKIANAVLPDKIILFGSYALGTQTIDSDIDLVVIANEKGSQHQKNIKVKRLFPGRDFSLDVFVFTSDEEKKYGMIRGTILNTAITTGKVWSAPL